MRKLGFFLVFLFLSCLALSLVRIEKAEATTVTVTRTFTSESTDAVMEHGGSPYIANWNATSGAFDYIGTAYWLGQRKSGSTYYVYRVSLPFDTGVLPDNATFSSAILSLKIEYNYSTTDFNVTIQHGVNYTYPHTPPISTDYYRLKYSGNGGSRNTTTLPPIDNYWNITLNTDGKSWINSTGLTKLVVRSDRDINGTANTGDEWISIYSCNRGVAYAPTLYVTYATNVYRYIVHAPYYEDGTVANVNITVTLQIENMDSNITTFNGAGGADTVTYNLEQCGIAFSWNMTNDLNLTRTYRLTNATFEELWLFIPKGSEPTYLYDFTVTDFAGLTNAYLEDRITVGGQNRIVERQKLDMINPVGYWMIQFHIYDLWITCTQGTVKVGSFQPKTEFNQGIIVTADMFPLLYGGTNVTINVTRTSATAIEINYTDSQALTDWLLIEVWHIQKYPTLKFIMDWETNNTGNVQSETWTSAISDRRYIVELHALRNRMYYYTFVVDTFNATATATNPWEDLFEVLGTWPFPASNFFAFVIILMVLGAFSALFLVVGIASTWLMALFLRYIGWFSAPWELLGLAGFVVVLIALAQAKRSEREM